MPLDFQAQAIRRDLRNSCDESVRRRRTIVGLSVLSSTVLGGIALYQCGICRSLPGPKTRWFDADAVNGSDAAYAKVQTPDALLGMASYALTACLAGMGPADRAVTEPAMPLAMAGKAVFDAALAGTLAVKQWTEFKRFSIWSLLVTAATVAALPFALIEAGSAAKDVTL